MEILKKLINKEDPHSSHRAINLMWGIGSFIGYWTSHFIFNKGKFQISDFVFIGSMAGITTIAAVFSKSYDNQQIDKKNNSENIDETTQQ